MKRFETVTIYRKKLTSDGVEWSAEGYKAFSVCFKDLLSCSQHDTFGFSEVSVRITTENNICSVGDMIYLGHNPPSTPNNKAHSDSF